jgi:hypothetical protein
MTDKVTPLAKDIMPLFNFALRVENPVAQTVLSISVVEMLGQQEKWSAAQSDIIKAAAESCIGSHLGTKSERQEVSEAILRSVHKISLRQGVFRLFEAFGLSECKSQWDGIYEERSKLVHGLAPEPGKDYNDLANRATSLCGSLLLRMLAHEIKASKVFTDISYPVHKANQAQT